MPEGGVRGLSATPEALSASGLEPSTGIMPRPPPSSGASLVKPHDVGWTDDTEPRMVLSLREPLASEPLPRPIAARLDMVSDGEAVRSYLVTKVRTVLGRGQDADVQVIDPRASRRHASIFFNGAEFRIRDSVNGTVLNGSRVVEYAIRDGDELLIGDACLRFHCQFE
jgi:hypothetical protein